MSYGLRYESDFDGINGQVYTVEIYEKDYAGSSDTILLSGQPVIHDWQVDERKPAIKGSQLTVRPINQEGSLPISSFYSDEDDTYLVKFYAGTYLLFTGYLLQDEMSEVLSDVSHEIELVFTDNLALLKDVSFGEAAKLWGDPVSYSRNVSGFGSSNVLKVTGAPFDIPIGTKFTLTGTSSDGVYTVEALDNYVFGLNFDIITIEPFASFSNTPATIDFIYPVDLTPLLPLTEIFRLCLKTTNLELDTKVSTSIICDGSTTDRFLEETYVRGEDFLKSDKWDSCYTVMEKILKRFGATLFQSEGIWNVVRWDELRRTDNTIVAYIYDSEFVYQSSGSLSTLFTYGNGSDIEAGALLSVERPYQFVKETFNYERPEVILRNADLLSIGSLLATYSSGPNTIYEYEWLYWSDGPTAPFPDRFIRVTKDAEGNEIERVGVIDGATGDDYTSAKGTAIEVNTGSKIKFSLQIKTDVSQAGPGFIRACKFNIFDGTNTYTLKSSGDWLTGSSAPNAGTIGIFSGQNSNVWNTFEFTSNEIPVDGLLYVYLGQADITGSPGETYFKDLSLDIDYRVIGSGDVIGHTHTRTQQVNTKNNSDETIEVDDTSINTLRGTMFLSTTTGVLRDRTSLWAWYPAQPTYLPLGQLTTFDNLFLAKKQRDRIESTLLGLVQSGNVLSASRIIRNALTGFDTKNYITGRLSINYKSDSAECTLFEMWEDSEVNDTDLESLYEFKYIREKK